MAGFRRGKVREHSAITQRRHVAQVRSMISDPQKLAAFDLAHPESNLTPLPIKRGPRVDHEDLEKHVVRAVGDLLAVHPRVLIAWRQNSGAASYEAASGKWAPVWFYKLVTSQPVRLPDYLGILRDHRFLAIECKRPSWTKPTDKREFEQAAFLMLVRNIGGIGEFITDIETLKAVLLA